MKKRQKPQNPRAGTASPPAKAVAGAKTSHSALVSQAVVAALLQQEQGASLDMALTRTLKDTRDLTAVERRQVVQQLNHINRQRARLTWHLTQVGSRVSPHHLLLARAALESGAEVKGLRYSENDLALVKLLKNRTLDDPKMPEAVRYECPPAFETPLRKALGPAFQDEMSASLLPPTVDLRVNLLKTTVAEARKRLRAEDLNPRQTPFSPWGLRCDAGANASATKAFQDGLIEFQDEASQLAAFLCDAKPGMQVLDFCSGTGGKALALAAAMENKGHLVACDISEVRLSRSKLRMKRAGAENAERKHLPAVDDKWMKKHYARFDRVLVDAPCSGTGSWRRNPDARWSPQAAKLDELTALQDEILARAAKFVKPGGMLIYATCSLLPQENDARVANFLKSHNEFSARDARTVWRSLTDRAWPYADEPVLRLSPAKHGTDGFFAAILSRATNPA